MENENKSRKWLKRLGWVGFLFFLVKGIIWLLAGAVIIEWMRNLFN